MPKHHTFLELLAKTEVKQGISLRHWQHNPKEGDSVWTVDRNHNVQKLIWEPKYRLVFEPYNAGEIFTKEWQAVEYAKARKELAMKYQYRFYGLTDQTELFNELEIVKKA